MMSKSKYIRQPLGDLPANFDSVTETYEHVRALDITSDNAKVRVMLVLDHVPAEDLNSGKLCFGPTGELLMNMFEYLQNTFPIKFSLEEMDLRVINFNLFRTYGKTEAFQAEAEEFFGSVMKEKIVDYAPDYVITFGPKPFKHLNDDKIIFAKGNYQNWYGVTIETTLKHKKNKVTFQHIPNISLNSVLNGKTIRSSSYLLGYVSRCMLPAFQGGMRYKIKDPGYGENRDYELIYVDTLSKLDRALKECRKAKYVAIDTEAENLNRIVNMMQTLQLAPSAKRCYVIPIFHRDSPFTPKEIKKVKARVREYLEENDNEFQIYTNAKYDLNLMKSTFKVRCYKANVWDIQAGEFGIDENMKVLSSVVGKGYYNLLNLSMQYGTDVYHRIPFGKEARATISEVDLDENVQEYAALDCIVPFRIFLKQIQKAKDMRYDLYRSLVGAQISDQIHAFSVLESTGAYADIDYLFKLNLPNSPINQVIADTEREFLSLPEVKEAGRRISEDDNVPKFGLMGAVELDRFDLSKYEHKQVLFFDVLKLVPIKESDKVRANGTKAGKIDKEFQEKYKDNKVVELFTTLNKAYKLRNAYVKSLLTLWGTSADFKHDRHIRPSYSYLDVVTGRSSASDPNLQQVPSRSELGKHIKRILASRPGRILVKCDYSAHEVRGWSIISGDVGVADVFEQGAKLRRRFRLVPDKWIHHLIDVEGDVHKINASYFFGLPISEITKDIRNAVKTVIFGLIYQQGDEGLAKSTKRKVEEIVKIKKQFLDRFPVGYKWFDKIKKFAKKNFFVESPVGRRRNLWGYLIPRSFPGVFSVHSACDRRAVNSPVQGFGSDLMMSAIRQFDLMKYEYFKEHGVYPDIELSVSVHDSLTVSVAYEWFWLAVDFIERAMTSAVVARVQSRHKGFEFTSTPEIDMEIGATERDVISWDRSFEALNDILEKSLKIKRDELGDKIDIAAVKHQMLEGQYNIMPEWMKKQLWANDIKIETMDKINPLSDSEKRLAEKWRAELKPNLKKWLAHEKTKVVKDATSSKIRVPLARLKSLGIKKKKE